MAKKFYWLKLQKDFFKRHDIRIIEDMPNGKDYILFYMKLLVESISHEGSLRFNETIPYNEQMLSTITNTNIDIVRSAVKLFGELGLMDLMEDGTLYMNEVQSMMGVETDWAEKKRLYRDSKKLEGQKKTLSDKSKRKSIELEKDIDKELEVKKPKTTTLTEKQVINFLHGKIYGNLYTKLLEFYKYRKEIKKPLKTIRSLSSLVNAIGSDYPTEEDLIWCIDYTMNKEYQGVNHDYLKYNTSGTKKQEEDIEVIF